MEIISKLVYELLGNIATAQIEPIMEPLKRLGYGFRCRIDGLYPSVVWNSREAFGPCIEGRGRFRRTGTVLGGACGCAVLKGGCRRDWYRLLHESDVYNDEEEDGKAAVGTKRTRDSTEEENDVAQRLR